VDDAVLRGTKTVARAQVNAYCYHLRADSAVHSAADVVREYLRTLTAAQPTLNYLDMPDAAAQYRLKHLLLMLTHGVVQEGGFRDGLRQCGAIRRLCREAFRADLRRVRWLPRSKAQTKAADAALRAVSAGTAGDSDSAQAESAGVCFGGKCNVNR